MRQLSIETGADRECSSGLFNQNMTKGEALWYDINQGTLAQDDRIACLQGLRIELIELHDVEAALLKGLQERSTCQAGRWSGIKRPPQICRFIVRTRINIRRVQVVDDLG